MPWASIAEDSTAFIDSSYLPTSTKLQEPSKMTKDALESLLTFWRTRQQSGEEPFIFSWVEERDAETLMPSEYPVRSLAPTQDPQQILSALLPGRQHRKTTTFVDGFTSSESEEATSDDAASPPAGSTWEWDHRQSRKRPFEDLEPGDKVSKHLTFQVFLTAKSANSDPTT